MNEVSPELLYDLYQLRSQDLQQKAARFRFVKEHNQEGSNGWGRSIAVVSALIAKVAQLMAGYAGKPVEGCC